MKRRTFLKVTGGSLVALFGTGAAVWSQMPVLPTRPAPDVQAAAGWISHNDGKYILTLPRIEMGQNITTSLKQIACTELGADWNAVEVKLHDTSMQKVRSTVGSESIQYFAEPLAQACAALRDALTNGKTVSDGERVDPRPIDELRSFKKGALGRQSPELVHGREIVTGKPLYAADIHRPGLVYGRVLRAPSSSEVTSKPKSWNINAARAVPGFLGVIEDCGPAIGKATGLGIVASRPGALSLIADALDIEWDVGSLPPQTDIQALIDVDKHLNSGPLPHTALEGVPEDGVWDIDLRVDLPFASHGQIEPRAAVAEWKEGQLKVWAGAQDAFFHRDFLADHFGVSQGDVTVQSCRIGGAFGGKVPCSAEAEAAALARAVQRPVKVQWTREQELTQAYHRPPSSHRVKARLEKGRVSDWDHQQVSSHVIFTPFAIPKWLQSGTDLAVGDPGTARGMETAYQFARSRAQYQLERLSVHTGAWRGLGAGPNMLTAETAMDEAARIAGIDPLDFRLVHISDPRLKTVLERVGSISNWQGSAVRKEGGKRYGRGIACGIYKQVSYAATVADIILDDEGEITITHMWCTHDCGRVFNADQVKAQCEGNLAWSIGMVLCAGLPVKDGRVVAEGFFHSPVPIMSQFPEMTIDLIESSEKPVGAGETAMISGPAAIANAVRSATGIRASRFPLEPKELAL